jgi:hypothetical protein
VAAANSAFLRIGLWETGAYAVVCAATLPKSRLVAATFPATAWEAERALRDLTFTRSECFLLVMSGMMVIGAAVAEADLDLASILAGHLTGELLGADRHSLP